MQITFEFICRDCGADARILWDTAREGAGPVELKPGVFLGGIIGAIFGMFAGGIVGAFLLGVPYLGG